MNQVQSTEKFRICPFCGYDEELCEADKDPYGKGYWCSDCDSFIYFDTDLRSAKVILEEGKKISEKKKHPTSHLKKNVSPLRYPGGKTKVLDQIAEKVDPNKRTFVDVYCGGGSVGLSLLLSERIDSLIMNDLDENVYALFATILNIPESLIDKINKIIPNRELYFESRQLLKTDTLSQEERAFRFLLQNRCAFSGIYDANPCTDLLARWNPKTLTKRIQAITEHRSQIKLYNQDALELIEEQFWNPEATIFIDPPYVQKGSQLYAHSYTEKDHRDLAELLESLVMGMPACADILVTYDADPLIIDLYQGFTELETWTRNYCIY